MAPPPMQAHRGTTSRSVIVHVLEYIWDAARALFGQTNAKAEGWVADRLLALLTGRSGARARLVVCAAHHDVARAIEHRVLIGRAAERAGRAVAETSKPGVIERVPGARSVVDAGVLREEAARRTGGRAGRVTPCTAAYSSTSAFCVGV
jgi:hypothetical protein